MVWSWWVLLVRLVEVDRVLLQQPFRVRDHNPPTVAYENHIPPGRGGSVRFGCGMKRATGAGPDSRRQSHGCVSSIIGELF